MRSIAIVRTTLVAGGLLSFAAGLALVVSSTAAAAIQWPWTGEHFLAATFTLFFLLAFSLVPLGVWSLQDPSETEPTVPEQVPTTPVPGRDVERIVDRRWPVSLPQSRRRRLREQLRETIVRTLVHRSDCDQATAEAMLENGTWTNDPIAAKFVRADPDREGTRLELAIDRLRFTRRLRRTVQAVLVLAEQEVNDR
ncbi:DUF7269 family protein [Natronobacterium texcoconense]|uniref:Uncharacterized protein n=1 Tax=Natronobacterium texcoconense TaxID=1095778 RepID=A0A1H1FG50_NATTX|nr:hypothetical protein [Natronobacterium texcoconense]SDQ99778.1 hypothetical protein SAMN04489842_1951 [Natronobacterium texcoconense]